MVPPRDGTDFEERLPADGFELQPGENMPLNCGGRLREKSNRGDEAR